MDIPAANSFTFTPEDADVGQRLDKALGADPRVGSRSRAEFLIDQGLVRMNGRVPKASYKVAAGDSLIVTLPVEAPTELVPLAMDLDYIYEDADLLVVNKPAGLVVHPAAGHADDTLVNALLHHHPDFRMKFNENRPGIVHRLDKDTSGLLVVAKTDQAQMNLVEQFQARTVNRYYEAYVMTGPLTHDQRFTSYLARHPTDRKRFASLRDDRGRIRRDVENPEPAVGKWAATNCRILTHTTNGITHVELKLETGRTHQIRVHLSEAGSPLVADPIYNRKSDQSVPAKERALLALAPRLALHARDLGFKHPRTGKDLMFSSSWPDDFISFRETYARMLR